MKSKVLIISLLILSLLAAFKSIAQTKVYPCGNGEGCASYVISADSGKILIADETFLKFYKTDAKITTTLESVFMDISVKFGLQFKKIMITYKRANGQAYKEYAITISPETANNIKEWAKTNL